MGKWTRFYRSSLTFSSKSEYSYSSNAIGHIDFPLNHTDGRSLPLVRLPNVLLCKLVRDMMHPSPAIRPLASEIDQRIKELTDNEHFDGQIGDLCKKRMQQKYSTRNDTDLSYTRTLRGMQMSETKLRQRCYSLG